MKEKYHRMHFREDKVKFMWYPEDPCLDNWNLFITLVLIFTSMVAPARVAFVVYDSFEWVIINQIVDFCFLIDIIVIFNSATYDEDFNIIQDRK